jgi:hypothetical protein
MSSNNNIFTHQASLSSAISEFDDDDGKFDQCDDVTELSTRSPFLSSASSSLIVTNPNNVLSNSGKLKFNDWVSLKRETIERKRYILLQKEYDTLLKVLHDRTLLKTRKDLKWAYNLIMKRNLQVIKEATDTGVKDIIVTPKPDNAVILPNGKPYLKLAVLEEFETIIKNAHEDGNHCGVLATFDRIKSVYYGISRDIVIEFISNHCQRCIDELPTPAKKRKPLNPIRAKSTFYHVLICNAPNWFDRRHG